MKKKTALEISDEIGFPFPKLHKVECLNKDLLIQKMSQRLTILEERMLRDFTGGMQSDIYTIRELKYWKEAIERKEFDLKEEN
jgi:hypothetical protein